MPASKSPSTSNLFKLNALFSLIWTVYCENLFVVKKRRDIITFATFIFFILHFVHRSWVMTLPENKAILELQKWQQSQCNGMWKNNNDMFSLLLLWLSFVVNVSLCICSCYVVRVGSLFIIPISSCEFFLVPVLGLEYQRKIVFTYEIGFSLRYQVIRENHTFPSPRLCNACYYNN